MPTTESRERRRSTSRRAWAFLVVAVVVPPAVAVTLAVVSPAVSGATGGPGWVTTTLIVPTVVAGLAVWSFTRATVLEESRIVPVVGVLVATAWLLYGVGLYALGTG